jgi:hypothetical protein
MRNENLDEKWTDVSCVTWAMQVCPNEKLICLYDEIDWNDCHRFKSWIFDVGDEYGILRSVDSVAQYVLASMCQVLFIQVMGR